MPTPSLLIVPARFKTGKLYSQIPTSGAGDFTVTRNTDARRFDSAGLVASVASGIPRLDYYTSGGVTGCPALLVEPAATNLALQSENFGTTWSRTRINAFGSGSVLNTTATLDPFGTNLADYIQEDTSASDTHRINQDIAITSGTTYTYTCFIKSAERFQAALYLFIGGVERYGVFNTNAGTATATNATVGIDNFGNGWYRCRVTFTATASVTQSFRILICDDSGNLSYTGTGTKGIYVVGAQLETGSVATSYIPTTAGTGSRSADVISVSGAVSGSIGQTAGTIYCEFAYFGQPVSRTGPIFLRSTALRGFAIGLALADVASTGIRFSSRNNSATINVPLVSGALQLGTYYKVAIGYDAGATPAGGAQASGVVTYVNGVQAGIGTLQVPDAGITQIRMYGANTTTEDEAFNGRIRAVALYNTRLTNAELATLTT